MKKTKSIVTAVVSSTLTWLFPVIFIYAQNASEIGVAEIFKPIGVFAICAIASLLIGELIFSSWDSAAFFAGMAGIFLANFSMIHEFLQKISPSFRYWHVLYLVVSLVVIVCLLMRRFKLTSDGVFVMNIVFGGLIAFNIVTALPAMIQQMSDQRLSRQQAAEAAQNDINYQTGKRNIYYILLDEYGSFIQLENDFGYDNSPFRDSLKEIGFNVSETSRNDVSQTGVVVANIMQLDYVSDASDSAARITSLTQNGVVQQLLRENGYEIKGVGDTSWMGIESEENTTTQSGTVDGSSFYDLCIQGSFLNVFISRNYTESAQLISDTFDELNEMEIVPNSSVFTMCYVSAPHLPYYFDKDGNLNPPSKWSNDSSGVNNDSYIGMVEYVNSRVLPAVRRIVEKDPDSIIIMFSDHGSRFGTVTESLLCNILNTMYYDGEQVEEFEGLSSVNTLRYVFNREFGMEMEYVELP